MTTATLPTPMPAAAAGRSVVLDGLDWAAYQKILDAMGDRRFRHTYDRGKLEIISPLFRHDYSGRALAILVRGLVAEFGLKVRSAGSTTLHKEGVDRGLEPDECFYIRHYDAVRGKHDLDFAVDPPPDLAVEVDLTHGSLDRLPVYAALGVSEVWRYRKGVLEVRSLRPDDGYAVVAQSPLFPGIDPGGLAGWVARAADLDDNELMAEFRAWIRQTLAPPTA